MMELRFVKTIYDKQTLLKTAFLFTDRAYLHLDQDEKCWLVSWKEKDENNIAPEAFENEMIEQLLHAQLLQSAADIRKLVLARAFASTIMDTEDAMDTDTCTTEKDADQEKNILQGWFDRGDVQL